MREWVICDRILYHPGDVNTGFIESVSGACRVFVDFWGDFVELYLCAEFERCLGCDAAEEAGNGGIRGGNCL